MKILILKSFYMCYISNPQRLWLISDYEKSIIFKEPNNTKFRYNFVLKRDKKERISRGMIMSFYSRHFLTKRKNIFNLNN